MVIHIARIDERHDLAACRVVSSCGDRVCALLTTKLRLAKKIRVAAVEMRLGLVIAAVFN